MLDLFFHYSITFFLHASIGALIVLIGTWLLYRLARRLNWHRHGTRSPRWIASVNRVSAIVILGLVVVATGLQTGTAITLAKAVEETAIDSTLQMLVAMSTPLGIHDADQPLTLTDAEHLLDQWTPQPLAESTKNIMRYGLFQKVSEYWQRFPETLKTLITRYSTKKKISLRELVNTAWRHSLLPVLDSAKWHALFFAYGLAGVIILLIAILEWSWLAFTRSNQHKFPSSSVTADEVSKATDL